jgi:hypothetical protein
MLQSAKNLVKFVQKFNPSNDTIIRLGITSRDEIEAFLELTEGNGNEIFLDIICLPTIKLSVRDGGRDRTYIDLKGTIDGYKVDLTFLKMISIEHSVTDEA